MPTFSSDLGIDLGTASTLVYVKGKGVILQEPSVVAINSATDEIMAIGAQAREMIGRTPENISTIRPLKDGVIANFDATRKMLHHFIKKAVGRTFIRPRVVISVPSGVTSVEKRAVIDATLNAGAREAYLIEGPIAAAIGAGLPVHEPRGSMILNIGSGTTEAAVVSLGGLVVSQSLRLGGEEMDEAIIRHIRRTYNMMIGERTAEDIKCRLGGAATSQAAVTAEVRGRDLTSGLPRTLAITAEEIAAALSDPIREITQTARSVLEATPPDLLSDVVETGLTLTGGGALLQGLPEHLSHALSIPVILAEDPLTCVVRGAGAALDELEKLKKVLITKRD